ncbi:hypothetical protein FDI69_gp073 [Rhodococcus phage Trina]|uniref:Uncharacterized protein n=1 Tax=Rhodococcus phage Trina TaxID=2027905 RepID=A0A2D1ADW4_9CAUD|nr:hypothetical protein FDI69_gp073 [Rhodococcus phage Trina]ASZ74887.1 hypothetical protein SEA_TRINA_73 [Rhodococcus phage Trina]
MKRISQYSKPELIALFEKYNLELPQTKPGKQPTVKEMVVQLGVYEINDETLRKMEEKHDFQPDEKTYENIAATSPSGDVVVMMTRKNPSFNFKTHKFTQERRFVPMSEEDAEQLISIWPGFHKATREEIQRYYR